MVISELGKSTCASWSWIFLVPAQNVPYTRKPSFRQTGMVGHHKACLYTLTCIHIHLSHTHTHISHTHTSHTHTHHTHTHTHSSMLDVPLTSVCIILGPTCIVQIKSLAQPGVPPTSSRSGNTTTVSPWSFSAASVTRILIHPLGEDVFG